MRSFIRSKYRDSVLKAKAFMFRDISSTISLADAKNGSAPNFLLALGLCCYTEFWGRLTEGIPKDNEETCFYAFLDRLGNRYRTQRLHSLFKPYRDIRNSLAHAYLDKDVTIRLRRGSCGIVFNSNQKQRKYTFYIRTYFDDFQTAVNNYIKELSTSEKAIQNMEKAFKGKVPLT